MTRFPATDAARRTTETAHPLSYTTAGPHAVDAFGSALYDSHAVPTHPEGGEDECPDGCGGFVVPTGDRDPRGISHVCSEACGWSA